MASGQGLFGFLGEVFTDIRQKVVEEGWFGRRVTPPHQDKTTDLDDNRGWTTWRDAAPYSHDHAQSRGQDQGIDR